MDRELACFKKILGLIMYSILLILTIFVIIVSIMYINKDQITSFINRSVIQNFTNYYSETRAKQIMKIDDDINNKVKEKLLMIAENNIKDNVTTINNKLNNIEENIKNSIGVSIANSVSSIIDPLTKKYEQEIINLENNNVALLQTINKNSLQTNQIDSLTEIVQKLEENQHILHALSTKNNLLSDEVNKMSSQLRRQEEENSVSGDDAVRLLELAQTEQKNGNSDLALMYLTKAIYTSNFSREYINKYVLMIEEISHKEDINKERAIGYVENGIRFLTALTPNTAINGINDLYSNIKELATTLAKLVDETEIELEKVEIPSLCAESYKKGLLAEGISESIKELEEAYTVCSPFIEDMQGEQKRIFQDLPAKIEALKKENFLAE